jgi:integral membrane protein (TIGR01906 family)
MSRLFMLVLVLGLMPFLILSNVFIFMSPSWLAYQYSQPDFPKAERFNDKDRLHFGSESIEYVRGNRTLEQFKALGVYDDREIKHMIDVRVLVDQIKIIDPILGLLLLASLVALAFRSATRALAARGLFYGAGLTIALFVAAGIFAVTGFNTFFTLFHRVFFQGDTWLFNYTDSLIQYYPLPFWFATIIALVVITLVEAFVMGVFGWWWGKRTAGQ